MPIVDSSRPITGGVDTHLDNHVAAALDANGGLLDVQSFANNAAGFVALHDWLRTFGPVGRVGVEGTGAYGAGLSRYLQSRGLESVETELRLLGADAESTIYAAAVADDLEHATL